MSWPNRWDTRRPSKLVIFLKASQIVYSHSDNDRLVLSGQNVFDNFGSVSAADSVDSWFDCVKTSLTRGKKGKRKKNQIQITWLDIVKQRFLNGRQTNAR